MSGLMLHKVTPAVALQYHKCAALLQTMLTSLQVFLDKLEPELAARLTALLSETTSAVMLQSLWLPD